MGPIEEAEVLLEPLKKITRSMARLLLAFLSRATTNRTRCAFYEPATSEGSQEVSGLIVVAVNVYINRYMGVVVDE